jgi:hypothetical protein
MVGRVAAAGTLVAVMAGAATGADQARLPSRLARCGGWTVDAPGGCTSSTPAGVTSTVLAVRLR